MAYLPITRAKIFEAVFAPPGGFLMAKNIVPGSEDLGNSLRLDRQICFPLYAASRLLTRAYQRFLEPLGLTYPQYVVLMILWEDAPCTVSHVGKRALLNSNTVTPVLKRLEQLGYVQRHRRASDERAVVINLTGAGSELKSLCNDIPYHLSQAIDLPAEKALEFKKLLEELIQTLGNLPGSENM